jgi:hypothetical protein
LPAVTLTTLRKAAPEERRRLLEAFFREHLGQVLGAPPAEIDLDSSLHMLGVDSLMAIQLHNRVWPALGTNLPVTVFLEGLSTAQIIGRLLEQMEREGAFGASAPPPAAPVADAMRVDRVDELPEAELDALLETLLADKEGPRKG